MTRFIIAAIFYKVKLECKLESKLNFMYPNYLIKYQELLVFSVYQNVARNSSQEHKRCRQESRNLLHFVLQVYERKL